MSVSAPAKKTHPGESVVLFDLFDLEGTMHAAQLDAEAGYPVCKECFTRFKPGSSAMLKFNLDDGICSDCD